MSCSPTNLSFDVRVNGSISPDGTVSIVLADTNNERKPNTSSFVKLSDGSRYIEPNVAELVPPLLKYCNRDNIHNSYHCNNLYRLLFTCANQHNKDRRYFEEVTRGIVDKPINEDAQYHIKAMMEHREDKSTIIDMCNQFESVCEDLMKDTHPLKKRFLDESKRARLMWH